MPVVPPDSTLQAIMTKVRRLTRSPSQSQLSDYDLQQYINTFVYYDFPEHLRTFALRTTFTFYTQPNIDTYQTNTTDPAAPLYDFINKYMAVYKPIYVAGNEVFYSQSREEFYGIYPPNQVVNFAAAGNGIQQIFTGVVASAPFLPNNVLFSSIGANNVGLGLHDDGNGNLVGDGTGTVNYLNGSYTLNFISPPASGQVVNSQVLYYQASRPASVCYFDYEFIFRPVPDQVYMVNLEVDARPTALLALSSNPQLNQWWQYIAYGAAKKVFEDRMDIESVQMIMPEFNMQQKLVLRATIVNNSTQRSSTIYTDQYFSGGQWWPNNTGY